jgi:hypothetical protein
VVQSNMSTVIYSSIHAVRDAFADSPADFPVGSTVQVRIQGRKRKTETYRLEEMSEMQSSMKSLHWVYVHPAPRQRDVIDWVGYRNQGILHSR